MVTCGKCSCEGTETIEQCVTRGGDYEAELREAIEWGWGVRRSSGWLCPAEAARPSYVPLSGWHPRLLKVPGAELLFTSFIILGN